MWPFRRREESRPQPFPIDGMAALGEAFAKSFAAQIEGNAKIATVFSSFIDQMGQLSIRQAARALGQKSASTRKRDGKGKWKPKEKQNGCQLCADPFTRNVTIEMIRAHRQHEAGYQETSGESEAGTISIASSSSPDVPEVPTELGN